MSLERVKGWHEMQQKVKNKQRKCVDDDKTSDDEYGKKEGKGREVTFGRGEKIAQRRRRLETLLQSGGSRDGACGRCGSSCALAGGNQRRYGTGAATQTAIQRQEEPSREQIGVPIDELSGFCTWGFAFST